MQDTAVTALAILGNLLFPCVNRWRVGVLFSGNGEQYFVNGAVASDAQIVLLLALVTQVQRFRKGGLGNKGARFMVYQRGLMAKPL